MIHPQHKLYTITINPHAGLPFTRTLSARLPQAVQWARALAATCHLPAAITITTSTGNICWTETISIPQP